MIAKLTRKKYSFKNKLFILMKKLPMIMYGRGITIRTKIFMQARNQKRAVTTPIWQKSP